MTTSTNLLSALCVLLPATLQELESFIDRSVSTSELQSLAETQELTFDNVFEVTPALIEKTLDQLLQEQPQLFIQLHLDALTHLAQFGESREAAWLAAFDRLATHLLWSDLDQLKGVLHQTACHALSSLMTGWHDFYMALLCRQRGQNVSALALFDRLTEHRNLKLRAKALNSRATVHHMLGDVQQALQDLARSLALWRGLDEPLEAGKVLYNTAAIETDLREYVSAEKRLREALRLFKRCHAARMITHAHNELGLILRDRGEWAEAQTHFNVALTQARRDGRHEHIGTFLINLGDCYLFQTQLDAAYEVYQQARDLLQTDLFDIEIAINLGLIEQIRGQTTQAHAHNLQALDTALRIGRRDLLPQIYFRLSVSGVGGAAEAHLQDGINLIEQSREPIAEESLKISLLGRWQQLYETQLIHYHQRDPQRALAISERTRARAFAESVSTQHDPFILSNVQAKLQPHEVVLSFFTTGVLDQDIPFLRKLPQNSVLRPHLLTPAHTFVFVITQDALRLHDCQLDPNLFVPLAERRHAPERWLEPKIMQTLYDRLFAIDPAVKDAAHIYLIPHGSLHYVSLSAVLANHTQRACGISYAPSVTMLQSMLSQTPIVQDSQNYVGLAFQGGAKGDFLRFAKREVAQVAHHWAQARVVYDVMSVEVIRPKMEAAQWLHIACHGWFNQEKPLDSYLELGNNVHLTAQTVLTWRLNARLVVLSACQTGVSRVLRGDEPMGLVRAFLVAGASAVLVTQWDVDDLATYLLINKFFELIAGENDRSLAIALVEAQQWLRTLSRVALQSLVGESADVPSGQFPFSDPIYWAAFNLIGAHLTR